MANQREASKQNWDSQSTIESISAGSFQRIADACELMAKDRQKLIEDYEYMRRDRDQYREWFRENEKRISAMKGIITKLKKKVEKAEQDVCFRQTEPK